MTWKTDDHNDAIARLEAAPSNPDHPQEATRWERFKGFVFPWIKKGSDLGDECISIRKLQQKNKAARTAAQAAELAARRQVQDQQVVKDFSANIDDIFATDGLPASAKMLKLAKLMAMNPDLAQQVDKVKELLTKLHLEKGVSIDPVYENKPLPKGESSSSGVQKHL